MSRARFFPKNERVHLSESALISLVNEYIQRYRQNNGKAHIKVILKKLGWNERQWAKFKDMAGSLLVWEHIPNFSVIANEDTTAQPIQGLETRGVSADEVQRKIQTTYGTLRSDLMSLGLSKQEVDAAVAMQNFGENRFANAMEAISSGVFSTAIKLQTQQRIIEKRLEVVRKQIDEYGTMSTEDRDNWVKEEGKLITQYSVIGKLLADIQNTWYQGSAQLALVRMRMRDESGHNNPGSPLRTQRVGKPAFRPTVLEAEEIKPPPETTPPHDQRPNPSGDEATAS